MIIKKDSEIVKAKGERRSLALKAKKESSDEECTTSGCEDEEYAMAVRDFKNFFKRRECSKPPKEKNQSAFIRGSWSDSGEEDDEKDKDETCLMAQASSEKQARKELSELKEKFSKLEKNKGVDIGCTKCQILKINNEKLKEEAFKLTQFEKSTHSLNEMLSNQKPSGDKSGLGFNSFEASSSGTKEIKFVKPQNNLPSCGYPQSKVDGPHKAQTAPKEIEGPPVCSPDVKKSPVVTFRVEYSNGVFIFLDTAYKGFLNQYSVFDSIIYTALKMDNLNITMEENIRIQEEKALSRGETFNWQTATYGKMEYYEDKDDCLTNFKSKFPARVLDNTMTPREALSWEPTVSPLNDNKIDFRISFDESDDEDYTIIYDKNSFSYKIFSVDNLKTDLKNDNDKVNMPSFLSPEPKFSYSNDLDFFKDFENKFPAIVYNDALTSKSDFLTEHIINP
ncbi:hypothetical protein Tco_0925576 [Tanacetum coccineum]|uniref:Alpha/beta hydrolases superfamily protein n=1 Tax=Tanacetum coccineum TaxID=301880 RepID=A0ABQ5D870_9ASTR